MLFLIEYDRNQGEIITIESFDDSKRQNAENARLDMELELDRLGTEREVVLLEAASEEALRRTHRRYLEISPNSRKHYASRDSLRLITSIRCLAAPQTTASPAVAV